MKRTSIFALWTFAIISFGTNVFLFYFQTDELTDLKRLLQDTIQAEALCQQTLNSIVIGNGGEVMMKTHESARNDKLGVEKNKLRKAYVELGGILNQDNERLFANSEDNKSMLEYMVKIARWRNHTASEDFEAELGPMLNYIKTKQITCKDQRHMGNADPHDGGWEICFDDILQLKAANCVVYSVGIGNDWTFDDAMEKYGCDVYSFDPTYTGNGTHKPWKMRTFGRLMEEFKHDRIDVLKIDIEGSEWKSLDQMLTSGTLQHHVKQLVLEIHIWNFKTPVHDDIKRRYRILQWIEESGFKLWNWHLNSLAFKIGSAGQPCCFELSWINTKL
ncbi:putative methyltransferase-like protein 24 isoform X2 [Glandiceps talaboti]